MTPRRAPNIVLRAWRESRSLTRSQMAAALSDTPSAQASQLACNPKLIEKWESGATLWPRPGYRDALRQLTSYHAAALGFITPGPHRHRQPPIEQADAAATAGPASLSGLTETELHAIDDLSALAGELHARGYTTSLATSPPGLTIGQRRIKGTQHITATGPGFCWEERPFSQRPPASIVRAADAIGILSDLARTCCSGSRP